MARTSSTSAVLCLIALLSCTKAGESGGGVPLTAATVGPVARATLKRVQGAVTVKRAAGDDWTTAVEQMVLLENDKVRTGQGAQAQIQFDNGSVVAVGEDALVGIAETRPQPGQGRADLTVLQGRIDAELKDVEKQSLSVATPTTAVKAGREIVFR